MFDGDEFDPASGLPFDMSRVHLGKKDIREEEANKEEKKEIVRKFGAAWEVTEEDVDYEREEELQYDGEKRGHQ